MVMEVRIRRRERSEGEDIAECKALFSSPNGVANAWILMHYAGVLRGRVLKVSIFKPDWRTHGAIG